MTTVRLASCACAFLCAALFSSPLPAQTARLINISTNGQVGTDANNMVGGFVIGGGPKTVLIRAIGPGLGAFGVPNTLPDPFLTLFDSGSKVIQTNDNWNAADLATMTSVGAFPLPTNSKDAVIVTTLQPGAYTAQISGLGIPPTGTAILEVYDVSGGGQLINIATRLQVGSGGNSATAGFVVSPGSGTRKLLVRGIGPALAAFGLPGTLADPKLVLFDGNASVVATAVANGSVGAVATANAQAGAFASSAGDAATIVTLNPGSYTVNLSSNGGAGAGIGLIEVYDITSSTGTPANLASASPTLYYANLRPTAAATTSTASGFATILFDPNTNIATVNVSFSNLSSTITAAHLVVGNNASSGNFVLNLPRTQANGLTWTFPASGLSSTTDLINALKNGQIFVDIDSTNFTSGELQGGFIQTAGSTTFNAPAAPPALSAAALTAPTQTDAARFLTQTTFGPTTADIATVTSGGITKWINDQMALPATSALAGLLADVTAFPNPPAPPGVLFTYAQTANWHAAWWKIALKAPDQLRQRVAFALSEILVVGDQSDLTHNIYSKVKYYDILVNSAFGNFRQLLDDATLSPAMGWWLTYRANQKADPVAGTVPDENYAREVQQLFSIGLVQLQPDGTLMLDSSGLPIPTYNQTTISETAKVLTGWSFAIAPSTTTDYNSYSARGPNVVDSPVYDPTNQWVVPMRYFDFFHDKTQKNIVSLQQVPLDQAKPTVIPANQTGPQELKILLDTLFNHPNTGPFICKQLIQRLVTSNPSPGYVYRVAQVFANDGTGVRGNLSAVVKALLTDYEARSATLLNNVGYGKIKEPLIRNTAFFRALNAAAPNGRYLDSWFGDSRGPFKWAPASQMAIPILHSAESPLGSPTVFNFFSPTFSPPGAMAAAGLVAPEMQITDEEYTLTVPNFMASFMYRLPSSLPVDAPTPSPFITLDYSEYLPLVGNPAALADQLNLIFCANQMTAATRTLLLSTLQAMPAAAADLERVQTALQFTLTSADSAIQK